MPRTTEELHKHTFYLRKGDVEKLRDLYPDVATAVVIRRIISNVIDRLETGSPELDIKGMVL